MHNVNMANIQVAPGKTELDRYLRKGMTQAQIAEAWEKDTGVKVSRTTIAMAIKRYELNSAHPRPRHDDMLPWHVKDEHRNHIEARMLRMEGRRRKGMPLSESDLNWLNKWRLQLDEKNAVVAYDPDHPEGFVWIPRTEEHDDIIHRGKV